MNKFKPPFKPRGQSYQDWFAYSVCGNNGTYIEIGAYKPVGKNNTFNLETQEQWRGFSIEFDERLKPLWEVCVERKNPICWGDAMQFNYKAQLESMNLPTRINYLSCDIEPPNNTFTALKKVIEEGIEFDCITYEHDLANPASAGMEDYNIISTEYLISKGYKVAVYGVYARDPSYHYETWFVKDDIDFPTISFDQWKKTMGILQ